MDASYEEQQLQEIEALESMYADELRVLCRDYPSISVELDVRPDMSEFAELFGKESVTLRATLPADYPNSSPRIELPDFEDNRENGEGGNTTFWRECTSKVDEELAKNIEECIGMPMLFSLFSALQDFLVQMSENYLKNRELMERKRADLAEKEEMARFEGTRVTLESFNKWNKAFLEEIRAKKSQEQKELENQLANRMTGKQLFIADQSLNISDLQFLDSKKAEGNGIEIDQSLFEDDLDLDSDEEDEDYNPNESVED